MMDIILMKCLLIFCDIKIIILRRLTFCLFPLWTSIKKKKLKPTIISASYTIVVNQFLSLY